MEVFSFFTRITVISSEYQVILEGNRTGAVIGSILKTLKLNN